MTISNPSAVNTMTIPRRITLGFLALILLTFLIGGFSLWQLLAIKQNVLVLRQLHPLGRHPQRDHQAQQRDDQAGPAVLPSGGKPGEHGHAQ